MQILSLSWGNDTSNVPVGQRRYRNVRIPVFQAKLITDGEAFTFMLIMTSIILERNILRV